jgi:hypothetical protein
VHVQAHVILNARFATPLPAAFRRPYGAHVLPPGHPIARIWRAATTLAVLTALVIQVPITAGAVEGFFDTPAARVVNLFLFFTILSNVLAGVTAAALALAPPRTDRPAGLLGRVARFDAVLAVTVTAAVYHTLLASLYHLVGAEAFADQLFHTVVPAMTVLGWLLFGPRDEVDRRVVAWSLAYPLAWLAMALVRGAIIGWYPYPFVDVLELGYGRVAVNAVGVTLLFLVLAAAYAGLDRLLIRSRDRRRGPVVA